MPLACKLLFQIQDLYGPFCKLCLEPNVGAT